jgi:hypothetical protein
MVNFLNQLENPQINYLKFFEVMRDYRKGGLNPTMYDELLQAIVDLPGLSQRKNEDYRIFDKFNLSDVSEEDFLIINREVIKRATEEGKFCWHPNASEQTCDMGSNGKIIISAAHSIQNNGVLSQIAKNGHVMGYELERGRHRGRLIGKNHASVFWGFCNTHDAIFRPIETSPFTATAEQLFLFAYRAFVVSVHVKVTTGIYMDFGDQAKEDIEQNKIIFNNAILANDFSVIKTETFELPSFYPIVVSAAFYLEYDFEGNRIEHSEERIENIFITLLPFGNKTYFLLSYLQQDEGLYGGLGEQLRRRNNLRSDITMLIAAHTENIFFHPQYYETFIKKLETVLDTISEEQMSYGPIGENGEIIEEHSLTPNNYLNNVHDINFFGY